MANATATELQQLYIAYFGRAADPTGLDYWTGEGTTTKAFAANMYAQAEFKSVYGSLTTEAQVNQIYQNLFDRDADAAGLLYWSKQIKSGALELASIANDLIWAAQNNSGSADDKKALDNKTSAAISYTDEVKKTTAGILAYSAASTDPFVAGANIEAAKTYFDGIDKDTASTSAGVTASVNTIISNGVQTGAAAKYTLTSDAPTVTEGDTDTKTLAFTVSLDKAATAATTVNYETLSTGTATAGDDFVATAGTVSFAKGQKTATVNVTINNDTDYESSGIAETIKIKFSGSDLSADVTAEGSIKENDTDPDLAAKSLTLTTGINTLTGNKGDDTFDGSTAGSLDTADTIDGGDGTDSLSFTIGAESLRPTIKNVEKVIFTATADTFNLDTRDITGATSFTSESSSGAAKINNLSSVVPVSINSGTAAQTINFLDTALSGSSDELTISLNNLQQTDTTNDVLEITDAGGTTNKLETLIIDSSSIGSTVDNLATTAVGTTTLKVTGDESLVITDAIDSEITTVNASANSGGVTVVGANTTALTMTGGSGADSLTSTTGDDTLTGGAGNDTLVASSGTDTVKGGTGNDTIKFAGSGGLTKVDTVDGGDGTDTLFYTSNEALSDDDFTLVSNVEIIDGGADQLSGSVGANAAAAGINTISMGDAAAADNVTVLAGFTNDLTVNLVADGATNVLDASAFTKKLSIVGLNTDGETNAPTLTGGTGSEDSLEIKIAADSGDFAVTGVTEIETIKITDNAAASAHTFTLALADANAASTSATVAAGTNETITVDATANAAGDNADTVTIDATLENDSKVVIKGGSAAETIILSASHNTNLGDTITAGGGNDTITFVTANIDSKDVIDGGDGTDALTLKTGADGVLIDTDFTNVTNVETITGFSDYELDLSKKISTKYTFISEKS